MGMFSMMSGRYLRDVLGDVRSGLQVFNGCGGAF